MSNLSDRNKMILAALAAVIAVVLGVVIFRGGDEVTEPTSETLPDPDIGVALDPMLTAVTSPVQYRVTETDPLEEVAPNTSVEVAPGANIVVGQHGVAELVWPNFLENELLTGADSLLSLSLPSEYEVILDQAAGTAVYRVLDLGLDAGADAGEGEDAGTAGEQGNRVQVKAGWVTVDIDEAPAEVIVSFIPGDAPAAWVVARSGSATVTRCASDDPDDCETVEIMPGQAAAFTAEGALPEPQDIDVSRVGAWLDQVRGGTATGSIAAVAFRCVVVADTTLLEAPDEESSPAGELAAGTVVAARERDETGQWVLVEAIVGGDEGWMAAADLDCVGPIDNLPVSVAEGEPTPTPEPLPTRAPATLVIVPTLATGTATRTPTATPAAVASISFTASESEITAGECTTLKWSVENIKAVYFNGSGVTGSGERRVCPTSDTTYTLRVELLDGTVEEKSITIKVARAEATNTPAPTNTPPPAATNTPPPPPTPFPSNTPVPTAEPTDPPPPTDPPDPTDPAPTDTPEA